MNTVRSILKSQNPAVWLILALYIAAITLVSSFHEVWRDEVVLINILRDSSSLWDFYLKTENYGHPRFWHTLLYLAYQIYPHYPVIKILNIIICSTAMGIFLTFSPFRLWQKVLFALGMFPIYIYPAFNRSYGLCMLLIVVLASLYKDRWKYILPVSLILFLLANTHAHTLIITMAISLTLAWEYGYSRSLRTPGNTSALILILAGIVLSIIQIIPDPSTSFTNLNEVTPRAAVKALIISIIFPGKIFPNIFGFPNPLFSNIVICATAIYLWNKKHLFTIFTLSVIGLSMFSILFYSSNALRHQGSVFLIFIFSIWLAGYESRNDLSSSLLSSLRRHLECRRDAYVAVILILQICAAYPLIHRDISGNYSSAKSLAAFLDKHPELDHAVFIPAPDYLFESAPYYKNDINIFIARETVFRSYARFTRESNPTLTLDELLSDGKKIQNERHLPVVFAIGHDLSNNGPFILHPSDGRTFSYSRESLEKFLHDTRLIAGFHGAISDENYDLYLLNEASHEHQP